MVELVEESGMERPGGSPVRNCVVHRKHYIDLQQSRLWHVVPDDNGQPPRRLALYIWPEPVMSVFQNAEQASVLDLGLRPRPRQPFDVIVKIYGRQLDEVRLGRVLTSNANT
jgi:hypothetical protein